MLLLAALLPLSTQGERNAVVEKEIRDNVMEFNRTYAENNLDTYFSFCAEDATLLFGSGRTALADYRKIWYELIAGGGGVEKNEITDIQVRVMPGGEVAIATYFGEVHTRSTEG